MRGDRRPAHLRRPHHRDRQRILPAQDHPAKAAESRHSKHSTTPSTVDTAGQPDEEATVTTPHTNRPTFDPAVTSTPTDPESRHQTAILLHPRHHFHPTPSP